MRPRSASSCRPTKTALCGQRRHTPCRGKEAHQPPSESEYIPFAVIERHIFFGYPKFNGGVARVRPVLEIWRSVSGKQPSTYFAVYRYCVKNNNLLEGRVIASILDKSLPNKKRPL